MLISKPLPKKCLDPSMFSLLCMIGNHFIKHVMLDLGASINVMSLSLFCEFGLSDLYETGVIIQLADRSSISSLGICENVLVSY